MDKTDTKDRAATMAREIPTTVGSLAGDARTRVEEMASQAAETADHVYGQVRDQVQGAATAATATVEKQPLAALMAVGLICGIVGFLSWRGADIDVADRYQTVEVNMGRGILLYLLGVPIPIIILLALLWR